MRGTRKESSRKCETDMLPFRGCLIFFSFTKYTFPERKVEYVGLQPAKEVYCPKMRIAKPTPGEARSEKPENGTEAN
uniref:Uncharacterized protein n=1 Tax=Anopheles atroparvus TaxID=41427 RepID=A0AAG5DC51_ANOAO